MPVPHTVIEAMTQGFYEYWNYTKHSLMNPSLYNPLYYLLLVYATTFVAESIFPKMLPYSTIKRKGFWTDILYVIFMDYLIAVIGLYAFTCGVEFLVFAFFHRLHIPTPVLHLDKLPPVLKFIIFFLIIDFLQWLAHFGLHRINFLWQFHKIHHAQETLGFASTRHFHFGEYILLKPATWIPFALCGFKAGNYVIYYIWIGYFLTFLSHCNIKINWGILKYIFITPETHYWHHASNIPGKYGVNYASSLVIWDLMFGHFFNPKNKTPKLGIPNNNVPSNMTGQFLYPFRTLFATDNELTENKSQGEIIKIKKKI